jgi:hypothetical protein
MITLNHSEDRIIASVNGKSFSAAYDSTLWATLTALLEEESNSQTIAEAKVVWDKFEAAMVVTPQSIIAGFTKEVVYNPKTDTYHFTNGTTVSPVPMPKALVDRLLYAIDKKYSIDPMIKFYARALRNPNVTNGPAAALFLRDLCNYAFQQYVSPKLLEAHTKEGYATDVASKMALVYQTPLTMEGLLSTKKVVRPLYDRTRYKFVFDADGNPKKVTRDNITRTIDEDTGAVSVSDPEFAEDWAFEPVVMGQSGDAFLCGSDKPGHIVRVGNEMHLPDWNMVDRNPNHSCVKGLHTGNQDYIRGLEREDTVTLNCFVDPAEVGAIPYRDVAGVMRTRSMFIHSIKERENENKNMYHSSTYAKMTDARWATLKTEALNRFNEELKDIQTALDSKKSYFDF